MNRILLFLLISIFGFIHAEEWIYYCSAYKLARISPDGLENEILKESNVPSGFHLTDISLDKTKLLYIKGIGGDFGEVVILDLESLDVQVTYLNPELPPPLAQIYFPEGFYFPEGASFTDNENEIIFIEDQYLYKYSFLDSSVTLLMENENGWGEIGHDNIRNISQSPDKTKIAYMEADSDSSHLIVFDIQTNATSVLGTFSTPYDGCSQKQVFWSTSNYILFSICDMNDLSNLFKIHSLNGESAQLIENEIFNIIETRESPIEKFVYTKNSQCPTCYRIIDLESNEISDPANNLHYEYNGSSLNWYSQSWSSDQSKVVMAGRDSLNTSYSSFLYIYDITTDSFTATTGTNYFIPVFWVEDNFEHNGCTAEDGTAGIDLWGECYSIENTTSLGWPPFIPDSATSFPEELFSLVNLNTLSINYSNISGEIPNQIGSLSNLTRLDLSSNQFSDIIPSEIGNLTNLTSLNLSSNQFSGVIPVEIFDLINLKGEIEFMTGPGGGASIFYQGLNLSDNMLTGSIQEEIGNLINLRSLDLSFNQLEGDLPIELYTLDSLQSLNLSNNLLTGEISEEIGNLLKLEGVTTYAHMSVTQYDAFNLSNNLFSGFIPSEICDLPLDWENIYMDENQGFSISNNQFCSPFPSCLENFVGTQDTTNCFGVPDGCTDFTGIDFGLCDMALGIGLINNNCEYISGCSWIADSIDYTESFFNSMDDCQHTCMALNNYNDLSFPISYRLYSNYPNPFNPITSLRYDLPEDGLVNITIYDMTGRIVKTLVNSSQTAGYKSIRWNATNDRNEPVSAGLYLYSIQAGGGRQTKKMVLLK